MKTKLLLTTLLSFSFYLLSSQVPQGFNYQAVASDDANKPIGNYALPVRITVQSDSLGGITYWIELHPAITTNSFGLFTLKLGKGLKQTGSTVASFNDIDWRIAPMFIKTEVNYNGWKTMGTTRLMSVPYSMVSDNLSGPVKKLAVKGLLSSPDSAIFEVKNNKGQTVFAVYNEGIRAYVDNGIVKGATKGGFAIGGFETVKGVSQNLMMISPDSARVYVDETKAKGATKGGFAIGGFNTVKSTTNKFMLLTPSNYFIGHSSGQLIDTVAKFNATLGYETAKSLKTGTNNVFIGYQSGLNTTTGGYNVFVGTQAGFINTYGAYNIAIGRKAGFATKDSSNIFIGDLTGRYNTYGYQNVMMGDWAGYNNTTGYRNIFMGAEAGWNNTTGYNNIFQGYRAGYSNSTGRYNTMLGYKAGYSSDTVHSQVLVGYRAGVYNTGGWNTMIGSLAGDSCVAGYENTFVGLASGQYCSGNRNVFFGRWAGRYEPVSNNYKLIIETKYEGTDNYNNALIYGDFSSKYLKVNGKILNSINNASGYMADFKNIGGSTDGMNITSGRTDGSGTNYMIDFRNGGGTWKGSIVLIDNVVSIYNVSDARLKENISESGIDAVKVLNEIRVVDYNFTKSPDISHTGYIAQDVQKVLPQMVVYNEKEDAYAISTATLIPILHKAIQEQQKEIEELKVLINVLLLNQSKSGQGNK